MELLSVIEAEGGPTIAEVLWRHPLPGGVPDSAVTSYLAASMGRLISRSFVPAPPGLPHVRSQQRAQALACLGWVRHRLGY